MAGVFQEMVSHLSQLKKGVLSASGSGVRKEVSFVEVVKEGQVGVEPGGSVMEMNGVGKDGGGVWKKKVSPTVTHAKLEDGVSFSKRQDFNAKSVAAR